MAGFHYLNQLHTAQNLTPTQDTVSVQLLGFQYLRYVINVITKVSGAGTMTVSLVNEIGTLNQTVASLIAFSTVGQRTMIYLNSQGTFHIHYLVTGTLVLNITDVLEAWG